MTMIDSERHLRCLSLKSALRFATMSSSPSSLSSSQMMWGTIGLTFVFDSVPTNDKSTVDPGSVLATEEDEDAEKANVEEEGDANSGADAF